MLEFNGERGTWAQRHSGREAFIDTISFKVNAIQYEAHLCRPRLKSSWGLMHTLLLAILLAHWLSIVP